MGSLCFYVKHNSRSNLSVFCADNDVMSLTSPTGGSKRLSINQSDSFHEGTQLKVVLDKTVINELDRPIHAVLNMS